MQSTLMHLSPHCGAYAPRTGQPCRNGDVTRPIRYAVTLSANGDAAGALGV